MGADRLPALRLRARRGLGAADMPGAGGHGPSRGGRSQIVIEVERPTSSMSSEPLLRCLVVGAGAGGRAIARDLLQTPDFGLRPIGFVDDDLSRRRVLGLPVLGSTASLAELAVKHRVEVVVIAIPSLSSAAIQRLVERASEA